MSIEHEMFSQEYDKVANERDNWQARAHTAERRVAELEAMLDTAVHVSINGAIHRVLPAPVGFAGNSWTEGAVTLGKLEVVPFGFADSLPDGE